MRTCTPSCSTSLRVARTALSGEASDEPVTSSIFLPPAVWSNSSSAMRTPRMESSPSTAKAPSRVASAPILMVSCASAGLASEAARTTAATLFTPALIAFLPRFFPSLLRTAAFEPRYLRGPPEPEPATEAVPQAEKSVRREQHDQQEGQADHRVEALAVDQVDGEVLQQDESDGADEGADRMAQAADHGDDQDVDHHVDADRARRNAPVEPHHQHAAGAGDEAGQEVGGDTVQGDVEADGAHAPRIVADRLQAEAEGRAGAVGHGEQEERRDREAQVVEGRRVTPVDAERSEEHTSELQSLMRISYAVFCLKKKNKT